MISFLTGMGKEKGRNIYPDSRNRNVIQQENRKVQINQTYFQKFGKEKVKVIKKGPYIRIVEAKIYLGEWENKS